MPSSSPQDQETPSVVRTHYEDDNDDDDHEGGGRRAARAAGSNAEQTPLISPARLSAPGSLHRRPEGSDHSLHTLQHKTHQHRPDPDPALVEEDPLTMTWLEWAIHNGVHPSTWTKHTYLRASLLVVLLTLVILSFTVLRVQDHIKDILRSVQCPILFYFSSIGTMRCDARAKKTARR